MAAAEAKKTPELDDEEGGAAVVEFTFSARSTTARGPMPARKPIIGEPVLVPLLRAAVSAGFPSPADDYADGPIDLTRTLITNAPATYIMRVSGDSAVDLGIFDGSLITVDRSLKPRDGDAVVVDVNGERSVKLFRIAGGQPGLAYGNRRYPDYDPGPDAEILIFGVITNSIRRFRR
ncbi:S24 family peptidase [Bosea sp. BK604]|uniref:LexA family protein n=1 Tax=Bosea sp. BK604 TaxID=2512180 RepID=UPI0010ECBAD5|nr:S24 family peptidase [Bosea sp. BK604]TCR64713.1 SOS response UmuD protein [Bosea sp. BK604]